MGNGIRLISAAAFVLIPNLANAHSGQNESAAAAAAQQVHFLSTVLHMIGFFMLTSVVFFVTTRVVNAILPKNRKFLK